MFGIKAMGTNAFHRLRLLLPPSTGRSPSLDEGGLGFRRSRPPALPSIAYRGFAVAPMTLRALARRFLYNSGCRVATLVVSMGVMGFLGDLRGRNSKSPPNPLGLAERVHRPQTMIPPRSPTPHSSCEFGFFFICFVCPKHMMFFFKNHQVSFRRMSRSSACFFSSNQRILKSESA